jgi:hypothetical protein
MRPGSKPVPCGSRISRSSSSIRVGGTLASALETLDAMCGDDLRALPTQQNRPPPRRIPQDIRRFAAFHTAVVLQLWGFLHDDVAVCFPDIHTSSSPFIGACLAWKMGRAVC